VHDADRQYRLLNSGLSHSLRFLYHLIFFLGTVYTLGMTHSLYCAFTICWKRLFGKNPTLFHHFPQNLGFFPLPTSALRFRRAGVTGTVFFVHGTVWP